MLDFISIFQNHQLKQTLKAKGPGHFPHLTCHPLCFAQDHASVPLCGVAVLGLHMAYPRGYTMAYCMLEQSLPLAYPMAYPWLTPGLPLAHQIPEASKPLAHPIAYHILEKSIPHGPPLASPSLGNSLPLAHPWPAHF